ncbi:MAG TPA: RagB/SusD family nutrient uptake outer membrane protein, partial [Paludibacter sp.]|nr:RagB/SusD family nutrient uptake outer membrane protein [Paludibacter sp.]
PYGTYADNQADLRKAIRHERRVELAMEGHRWFDLCRWGIAKEVMDTYKATETPEAQSHMAAFIAGKHELFPIPSQEIDLSPMEQNPQY